MTVGELIQQLERYREECDVEIYFGDTKLQRLSDRKAAKAERAMDPWLTPVEVMPDDDNENVVEIRVVDDFEKDGAKRVPSKKSRGPR